jgi:Holliday junction DNA helicase RuvA
MIGMIEGEIVTKASGKLLVLLDSGVGYEIYSGQEFASGERIRLFTSHIQRENSQELFGFLTIEDKSIFELLLSVNGIGPKSAFSLVSLLGTDGVKRAIQSEDEKSLKSAQGIGPKAAKQIILSLKEQISKMEMSSVDSALDGFSISTANGANTNQKLYQEVSSVLLELGFGQQHFSKKVCSCIEENQTAKAEEIVKMVLKSLH